MNQQSIMAANNYISYSEFFERTIYVNNIHGNTLMDIIENTLLDNINNTSISIHHITLHDLTQLYPSQYSSLFLGEINVTQNPNTYMQLIEPSIELPHDTIDRLYTIFHRIRLVGEMTISGIYIHH